MPGEPLKRKNTVGGGARQGEEAHAHACKYFHGCERERGDSVAKPRRHLRRVEDEASGVYHVEVEVEARGTHTRLQLQCGDSRYMALR